MTYTHNFSNGNNLVIYDTCKRLSVKINEIARFHKES